jgi:transposase
MDNEDVRRLSPAEQHARRRQVIRAYKRKLNKAQIARDVGLSYSATCKIIERYEAEGLAALAPRQRGRRSGDKRVLSAEHEAQICATICDKRPEQLKMEFALWSRAAVCALIERQFKVSLHLRSVGKYLSRWGFTPQKPIKRAYEQSPDAGRKVFLILDNLSVHHCKPVKQWLVEHGEQMEVFYLPSYSPELNPEERLNADLTQIIGRKVPMRTKAKLRAAAEQHMEVIGSEPERVKAYFRNPRVKYAA